MANEATIHTSLRIRKTDSDGNPQLEYQSAPQVFRADVSGTIGTTPGAIWVTTAGVSVDLTALTVCGLCWIGNLGDTYRFDVGVWDPDNSKFFPLFEVPPHEFYTFRLSQNLTQEYGTGTGTTGAASNALRLKAVTGGTWARVDAFER